MNKEIITTCIAAWQRAAGMRLAQLRKAQLRKDPLDIEWYLIQVKSANQLAAKYRRQLKEVSAN